MNFMCRGWVFENNTEVGLVLPVVKVDAFSRINASSLGSRIWEVDAMLRPGGVLYVRFSIYCNILQLICMNV